MGVLLLTKTGSSVHRTITLHDNMIILQPFMQSLPHRTTTVNNYKKQNRHDVSLVFSYVKACFTFEELFDHE